VDCLLSYVAGLQIFLNFFKSIGNNRQLYLREEKEHWVYLLHMKG